MKIVISLLFILTMHTMHCLGQVSDSVAVHHFNRYWQGIRPIDSAGYANYKLNTRYFMKWFRNDSLFVKMREEGNSIPQTLFIGEYTTKDSVHFIDFLDSIREYISIENIYGNYISRNQLPQLKEITLGSNSLKFVSCDLYIIIDSGPVTFHINKAEFTASIRNCLMKLKDGGSILTDDVKVLCPDGTIRNLPGFGYMIKE